MQTIKGPSIDTFGDVVAHHIDLLFEGHRFKYRTFGQIKLDYLLKQRVFDRLLGLVY